jgi:hypothetical protein
MGLSVAVDPVPPYVVNDAHLRQAEEWGRGEGVRGPASWRQVASKYLHGVTTDQEVFDFTDPAR